MAKKDEKNHDYGWCCYCGVEGSKFPTFAVLLLVFAAVWLLNDLRIISLDIPWIPVIIIIIAVGMIFNRYR